MGLLRAPVPFNAVQFRDLGARGQARDVERFILPTGPGVTSVPDVVTSTAQLMRSGFAVHLSVRG